MRIINPTENKIMHGKLLIIIHIRGAWSSSSLNEVMFFSFYFFLINLVPDISYLSYVFPEFTDLNHLRYIAGKNSLQAPS
jgi:hypothetical protein